MKFNWSNGFFAIIAAMFIVGIVYAVTYQQQSSKSICSSAVPANSEDSLLEDSLDYFQCYDTSYKASFDSVISKYRAEYTLMDTIISMSQSIREKSDKDYSGYYWQWMRNCNVQIGIYLRKKGRYHRRLYVSDAFAALDSVNHFIDVVANYDISQLAMNETAEIKWVIDYLRTEEIYQLLCYKMRNTNDQAVVYQDYRNWFWTSEAINNFYYKVIQGGESGHGSMSPMDLAYAALSISVWHRSCLQEELNALNGKYTKIGGHYRDIIRQDFEKEKKRYIQESKKYASGDSQKCLDKKRIVDASDSLINVFSHWIVCRDSLGKTLKNKKYVKIFSNSTQRIKWNMYQLWQNNFSVPSHI